jgi:hypothetical protein
VLVVGSGHSAINALLELAALKQDAPQTTIYWAMRGTNLRRVYGGETDDALPARGQLGTRIRTHVDAHNIQIVAPFRVRELQITEKGVAVTGITSEGKETLIVDEIISATGARPNIDMLRELRLDLDPSLESTRALGPMIDPNIHSCGTVRPHGEAELRQPEKNFYMVGMKSYGRAPTFLLATGYEQVRSVVAALVGDWQAARDVQLVLPETGVCSSDLSEDGSCCGSGVKQNVASSAGLINLTTIPVLSNALQPVSLQQTATRDCGCEDSCCGDGVRSTTCGCDTSCCN